uniref:C2H2-type domain-containing protein n=2 Tax=Pyxicephalus adspersus TaxID=30357 RepID=A0AAV2ZK20_PYXAD|nr:TPA: hypothetical protein GDO54_004800 [Pyxicephalus adspersus]
MLEPPDYEQSLKSNGVSDSTARSHSHPDPTSNIKEEPLEDDDVIITKILISREAAPMEYKFSKRHNEPVLQETPMVQKRPNSSLKPSMTPIGSYSHSSSLGYPRKERRSTYVCRQCGKCFMSDSELSKHEMIHTESRAFICSVCGKCFFTEPDLHGHVKSHFNGKTAYDVPFGLDCALLAENERFRCHFCGDTFDGNVELAAHQLVHFKNPYTCTECGRNFLSKSGLVTHQKTHSRHFDCPRCGKSFLSRANLLLHQEVHLKSKPGLAPEAEAGFDGDSDIVVCQIDELFSCAECGEIYDSRVGFLRHQQRHLTANSYACSECGKLFNRKSGLSLHRRVVHQGNISFSCPDCGKGFSCHSELARHIRVHTGEQPYSCTQCGKCFSFKSALVRHQRIHSGNRPYVCSTCSKGFSCNSALQRHQSIHLKDSFLF